MYLRVSGICSAWDNGAGRLHSAGVIVLHRNPHSGSVLSRVEAHRGGCVIVVPLSSVFTWQFRGRNLVGFDGVLLSVRKHRCLNVSFNSVTFYTCKLHGDEIPFENIVNAHSHFEPSLGTSQQAVLTC